jgi:cation diffusion facilitator CzcD-associated flavoprotein CzcO
VAKKYSADRYIKLSHEVTECRWDDATAKWHVTVKNLQTGEALKDTSDVLITARGTLNTPSWPKIDGLDTFKGEVMHSAKWNERYSTGSDVFRPSIRGISLTTIVATTSPTSASAL